MVVVRSVEPVSIMVLVGLKVIRIELLHNQVSSLLKRIHQLNVSWNQMLNMLEMISAMLRVKMLLDVAHSVISTKDAMLSLGHHTKVVPVG